MARLSARLSDYLGNETSPYLHRSWRWPAILTGEGLCAYHAHAEGIRHAYLPLEHKRDFMLAREVGASRSFQRVVSEMNAVVLDL